MIIKKKDNEINNQKERLDKQVYSLLILFYLNLFFIQIFFKNQINYENEKCLKDLKEKLNSKVCIKLFFYHKL